MKVIKSFFTDHTGTDLFLYQWIPDSKPIAVVQIVHGMAEHAGRYQRLAEFLTNQGIAVYADDHQGHGFTVQDGKSWGVLPYGFISMVENEKELTEKIRKDYPDTPIFLFGHSMGSFISRHYLAKYKKAVNGVILSGTGNPTYVELLGGLFIATLQCFLFGKKSPAKFLDKLAFGGYNRKFAPNRTAFDWLSRDKIEVDTYVQDPLCGTVFPTGFYRSFFRALLFLKTKKSVRQIPTGIQVLFLSGQEDPAGDFGKGVKSVYETFKQQDFKNLELRLFPGCRHELLNETNRGEVMEELCHWVRNNL